MVLILQVIQKRLFHRGGAPKAAGPGKSPERQEGPGRGGRVDRPVSETEEGRARIAHGLRKWLGRWKLCDGRVMGARKIRGALGNFGGGRRVNLSQAPHETIRRFPPLLPLLPLMTIVTLVSFVTDGGGIGFNLNSAAKGRVWTD